MRSREHSSGDQLTAPGGKGKSSGVVWGNVGTFAGPSSVTDAPRDKCHLAGLNHETVGTFEYAEDNLPDIDGFQGD